VAKGLEMTKKDFELIADVLRVAGETARLFPELSPVEFHYAIASDFASQLGSTNPRFDRQRFERAAGL